MKKNLIAALLSGTLVFTMTPAEFIASIQASETVGNSDVWTRSAHAVLYECKSSVEAEDKNDSTTKYAANTDLRSQAGYVAIDLGKVSADKKLTPVTLTFTFLSEKGQNQFSHLICDAETFGLKLTWQNGFTGRLDAQNTSASLEITSKEDASVGKHEDPVLIMDTEQRLGWPVYLRYEITPAEYTVTPQPTITKHYGQTLTPEDITCSYQAGTETKTGTLASLGLIEIKGEGARKEAAVGNNYVLSYDPVTQGRNHFTFENSNLTIEQTTPEESEISVIHSEYGDALSCYEVTSKFINPYSKEEVAGTFEWKEPEKIVSATTQEYGYTFTPEDDENYTVYEGKVAVVKNGYFSKQPGNEVTTFTVDPDSLHPSYNKYNQTIRFETNYPDDLKSQIHIEYFDLDGKSLGTQGVKDAGKYIVKVSIPENTIFNGTRYSAFNGTFNLEISPIEAPLIWQIYETPYTGKNTAQIASVATNLNDCKLEGLVDGQYVEITSTNVNSFYTALFENTNIGTSDVSITLNEGMETQLTGALAKNYILPTSFTTTGKITTNPIDLFLKDGIEKPYGQSFNLVASDFTAQDKYGHQVFLDGLALEANSEAENPEAEAGEYAITATLGDNHYSVNKVESKLKVVPVEPEEVSVSSGFGTIGNKASCLVSSLNGTFRNPYTLKDVPGTIELHQDSLDEELLADGKTLNYVFTPTDQKNYKPVSGTFNVQNKDGEPVDISIVRNSFEYDGQEHQVEASASDASIEYEFTEEAKQLLVNKKAVNAGTYDVNVKATVNQGVNGKIGNVVATKLVITPVQPVVTVPTTTVKKGTRLSEILPEYTATVNGKAVDGQFSWQLVGGTEDPAEVEAVDGNSYHWTWTPADTQNLLEVSGSTKIQIQSESTTVPDAGGTTDKTTTQGGNNNHSSGTSGGGGSSSAPSGGSSSTSGNENNEVIEEEPTAPQPEEEMPEESTSETTTTVETPDAKISYTRDETGLVAAYVEITPTAAAAGTAKVEMPAIKAGTQSSGAITLEIPQDITKPVSVLIPVENANYGTMALALDANGNETPYPYCYYDGNGSLVVPAGQSFTLVIKNMAKTFSDVPGDPNVYPANTIAFLSARGIMTGKGNGEGFAPLENLTRGQLALMLYRLDGQKDLYDNTAVPADVAENEYFARAAKWAVGSALMGQGGSSFNGYAPVTREQMALILYRYNGSTGADQSKLSGYTDSGLASSEEARDAISSLVAQGIMGKGTNSLKPTENATRQDVAAMIARWIQPALTTLK